MLMSGSPHPPAAPNICLKRAESQKKVVLKGMEGKLCISHNTVTYAKLLYWSQKMKICWKWTEWPPLIYGFSCFDLYNKLFVLGLFVCFFCKNGKVFLLFVEPNRMAFQLLCGPPYNERCKAASFRKKKLIIVLNHKYYFKGWMLSFHCISSAKTIQFNCVL